MMDSASYTTKTKTAIWLAAPYFAVAVFWCGLSNAWLAILAYHAQILWFSRKDITETSWKISPRFILLALPAVLAGPLIWWLLPHITHTDFPAWLADHHLSRLSLAVMIPYFGLVHPVLEQIHWAPLREKTPLAHPLFAGYHMLVLFSLLTVPWLAIGFVALAAASVAWQFLAKRSGSLAAPIASHILADLGIVIAAWSRL
jgi:hypothetical protein